MDGVQMSPEQEAAVEQGVLFEALRGTEEYRKLEALMDSALSRLLLEAMSSQDPVACMCSCQRARQVLDVRMMADGAISEKDVVLKGVREAYEAAQRGAGIPPEELARRRSAARQAAEGYSRPSRSYGVDPRLRGIGRVG